MSDVPMMVGASVSYLFELDSNSNSMDGVEITPWIW